MSFQHLLVPLDFSECSDQVVAYAIELAKKLQACLTLLHVVYLPQMVEVDIVPYQQQMEETAKQTLEHHLKQVQDAGLEAEMVTLRGVPFREIANLAKERDIDLIVMGTHGRTGLQHAFIGSVAEKVVRLAPCPVLVVRQPDKAHTL